MPIESHKPDLKRTDLSPVEALLVERALGDEARRDAQSGTLARIQQLTAARALLFAHSSANPLLGPTNGARIRELSIEIEQLWITLRRERANRRAEIERALRIEPEEEDSQQEVLPRASRPRSPGAA